MCARKVVDAVRLEREHPGRGGDEGKRGRRRAWEGRERNNLLGLQGCALVARRAAGEDGRHRIIVCHNVEEGGLHPTCLQMTATCKLAERLHSTSHDRQQAEEGEGNINNGGNNQYV